MKYLILLIILFINIIQIICLDNAGGIKSEVKINNNEIKAGGSSENSLIEEKEEWIHSLHRPRLGGVFVGGVRHDPLASLPGLASLFGHSGLGGLGGNHHHHKPKNPNPFLNAGKKKNPFLSGNQRFGGQLGGQLGGNPRQLGGGLGKKPSLAASALMKLPTVAEAPATSCVFELDGERYDLSKLTLKPGEPEYATEDRTHEIYKMNFCGVATTTVAGASCMRNQGMICQYRAAPMMSMNGVVARWGAPPYAKWQFIDPNNRDQGIKLDFANGDDCTVRGQKKPRSGSIYFVCDKSAGFIGNIQAEEVSTCNYVFTVPTKYACLGQAGLSWGWVFIIVTIFITSAYIVLGCVYNRFRYETKGTDAFPNREFWLSVPGLVKDGCQFTYNTVQQKLNKNPDGDDL